MVQEDDQNEQGSVDIPPPTDGADEATRSYGDGIVTPGTQIDQYRLISLLGEGGCGMVYAADQVHPLRRRVALKIIKPGMDTRNVIARFDAERQALALLDHPNIARVYDAGTTTNGRPYFVMEHVRGLPIAEHCDRNRLSVEERLELFQQVCDAVQHAHQKGIIHRDLKPSNILVSFEGDKAIPKVIDFGIAKAVSQPLTDHTLQTGQGQLIGTLEYMSPEQAEMVDRDIDTRSDIYSLGIVVYELLAGVLPFDSQTLRETSPESIRRIICEQEPRMPSVRFGHLDPAEAVEIARLRRTDPAGLRRRLRGDLDWITLRAMAKDRRRRYSSAGELSADLRRHTEHEPVTAGPPSTLYRIGKFGRRHRALVAASAAVLTVFLLGVAGVAVFAWKADRQADEAHRHARAARAVADFLTVDLLGAVAPEHMGSSEVTVHAILDAASQRLQGRFQDEPLVEASVRQTIGETYVKLGDYRLAETHLRWAYETRRKQLGDAEPDTVVSMSHLGRLYYLQARFREAEPLLADSWRVRSDRLGPDHVLTLETATWLGLLYLYRAPIGGTEQAEALLTSAYERSLRLLGDEHPITLEAMYGLAFLHGFYWWQYENAGLLCARGMQIAERVLGEDHRLTRQFCAMLAWFYARQGQHELAVKRAASVLETNRRMLGEEHPDTLFAMGTLGMVYGMESQYELAEPLLAESVRLSRHVLGESHASTILFSRVLAQAYKCQGRYDQAETLLLEILDKGRRSLGDEHAFVDGARFSIQYLYAAQGQVERLNAWCASELRGLRDACGQRSMPVASFLNNLAWVRATYPDKAIRNGLQAIEDATEACEITQWQMSNYLDTLAAAYAETGDFTTAVAWQKKAIDLRASAVEKQRVPESMLRHPLHLYESGRPIRESSTTRDSRILLASGRFEEAEHILANTLAANRRYLGASHPECRGCILALIELYDAWSKPEEAEKWRTELDRQGDAR